MEAKNKTLDYYMRLPYTVEVKRDAESARSWFARVVELPGCMTEAETFEDLDAMIEDAKRGWIEDALEHGDPIPEPQKLTYSGKVNLRMPKSLHRDLARRAEEEGVSLNQLMTTTLARSVGENIEREGQPRDVGTQVFHPGETCLATGWYHVVDKGIGPKSQWERREKKYVEEGDSFPPVPGTGSAQGYVMSGP